MIPTRISTTEDLARRLTAARRVVGRHASGTSTTAERHDKAFAESVDHPPDSPPRAR